MHDSVDPVVACSSAVLGGPMGEHGAGHPWWTPRRVTLSAATAVLALGTGWAAGRMPADGSGVPALAAYATDLAERVIGVEAWAPILWVLAALALVASGLLADPGPGGWSGGWSGMAWAVAPIFALHWHSWDLLAAACVALAAWATLHGRVVLAGAAVGVAASLTVLGLPLLLGLLLSPAVGSWGVGGRLRLLAAAVPAWLIGSSPWLLTDREGPWGLLEVGPESWWLLVSQAFDVTVPRGVLLAVTTGLVLVATLLLALLPALSLYPRCPGTPRPSPLAGALLLVLAALLVFPSAPAQAALVALPLAALVVPRCRDLLVWQACEIVAWVVTVWYLAGWLAPSSGGDSVFLWLAIVLRVAGVVWLAGAVIPLVLGGSVDDDVVEVGGREAHPDADLLADGGHPRP